MQETRSIYREYLEALLIAAIFLGFSNNFVIKTFFIPSSSMEETLLVGDHLFVNRYIFGAGSAPERALLPLRDVRRGDIVIFLSQEEPQNDLVKRCIGVPGDRIRIDRKELFVNDKTVDDGLYTIHGDNIVYSNRPIYPRRNRLRDNLDTVEVPEGEYFFLGDNRDFSHDSRFWGTVPRHHIKGRAFLIYWSYEGETSDGKWRSWSVKLNQIFRTLLGFPTKTRWERTFHVIR